VIEAGLDVFIDLGKVLFRIGTAPTSSARRAQSINFCGDCSSPHSL
jgi:hypothetical protein